MNNKPERTLKPYLSPYGAWAFALGTSIGWGSLVITSNTYLMQAGPLGSTLGMVLGGVIMMLIAWNYAYMMNCYPEAGGAYAYSREVFGYDVYLGEALLSIAALLVTAFFLTKSKKLQPA
jgi:amino acid transporter